MEGVSAKLKNWWQQRNNGKSIEQPSVSEEVMHLFRLRREHSLLQA